METAMLVGEILLAVVVLYALSRMRIVRTGVKVAWFSFFFEAFGSRPKDQKSIERPRETSSAELGPPNSDGNPI